MIPIFHNKNQAVSIIHCQTAACLFVNVASWAKLFFTGNGTRGCRKIFYSKHRLNIWKNCGAGLHFGRSKVGSRSS